jgi:hypothetical protein
MSIYFCYNFLKVFKYIFWIFKTKGSSEPGSLIDALHDQTPIQQESIFRLDSASWSVKGDTSYSKNSGRIKWNA